MCKIRVRQHGAWGRIRFTVYINLEVVCICVFIQNNWYTYLSNEYVYSYFINNEYTYTLFLSHGKNQISTISLYI